MKLSDLREILSKNIKLRRKSLAYTQEQLAEKTGLAAQTINDIEGCRTWVSDKTLVKLAEVLRTSPAELLISPVSSNNNIDIIKFKTKIQDSVHQTIEELFTSCYSTK